MDVSVIKENHTDVVISTQGEFIYVNVSKSTGCTTARAADKPRQILHQLDLQACVEPKGTSNKDSNNPVTIMLKQGNEADNQNRILCTTRQISHHQFSP